MKTRDEVLADLSVLLDKPILTNWEVAQAIRILAGVMLDVQDLLLLRVVRPEELDIPIINSAATAKYPREVLDQLRAAGEISHMQYDRLMLEAK